MQQGFTADAAPQSRVGGRHFGARRLMLGCTSLCLALPILQARAADTGTGASQEAIIVTGTRETGRKARQSLNPIDVISQKQLVETGRDNLRDALMQLLPSISHQTQGTSVGALVDSINLRGLSPNQTLILVNGIRRHPTGSTQTDAGPFRGATPADIDLIPISLVDHIEVLRDGASAQYGSDAVAGVVNIILKSAPTGGSVTSQSGIYGKGDGYTQDLDIDKGYSLGENGSVHVGLSYEHHARTDRDGVDSRTGVLDSHWIGDPLSNRVSIGLAGNYHFSADVEGYSTITYAHRAEDDFQIYRLPTILPKIYPFGFSPKLSDNEDDGAITAGLRGKALAGWDWDISSTYGIDRVSVNMSNSANTSLYALTGSTPTDFHLSDNTAQQLTTDLNLKRVVTPWFWQFPINVALGAEHRYETYSLGAGSYGSYVDGGSQAVPGVLPQAAATASRDVYGVYGDLATNLLTHWQIDLAGRLEHYTDFGNTASGKVSTRYDFTPGIAIRGTFGNSIRAPTLAEEYHTSATVTTVGATGELAPSSAGAAVLGAQPLQPERSTNITAGVVLQPFHNMNVAVDGYQIDIRDRILDGGTYSGALAIAAFAADGRVLPIGTSSSAVSASYLTNGAATRTRGLDLTAGYHVSLGAGGNLALDGALNLNETNILSIAKNKLGRSDLNLQQIAYLTTDAPRNVANAGGTWAIGRWTVVGHEIRYGHIFDQMTYQTGPHAYSSSLFQPYTANPRFLTNLAVSYDVTEKLRVTLGADNLFDSYPTKVPVLARYYNQALYDRYAEQIGFNGGFYYLKLRYLL